MRALRTHFVLYLLVAPVLIYFVLFVFYPLGMGLWLSFQKAGMMGPQGFVGLLNYQKILVSGAVWDAAWNTMAIAAGITLFGTLVPIIPAIALAEISPDPLRRALQTTIYTPYLLSWVIIIGVWMNTLSPIGIVNAVLIGLHVITQPITFFASTTWAQPLVVGQTVWKDMGFHALIYYAALMSVDPELIEAATMDGAKGWHKIRDLILPHLAPVIGVVFMLTLQGALHTFDSAFLMANGRTAEKVTTLAVYAYQKGVLQFDLGMASAAGVVLLALCLVVAALSRWLLPQRARI
jgi:putative aldouronate transport system permease protein